jgi:hypothetical protein
MAIITVEHPCPAKEMQEVADLHGVVLVVVAQEP